MKIIRTVVTSFAFEMLIGDRMWLQNVDGKRMNWISGAVLTNLNYIMHVDIKYA